VIGDLKPHAAYKDSGQEWLGFIPAHWAFLRAKRLFREVDERSKSGKEELLSVSHLTGVTPRRLKTVTMFMAESNVGHKVCHPGDLVINTLWAWMAALGVTRHVGIVSPAYGVYRLIADSGILPAYADHLLRTPLYAAEYQRRSTGVNTSRLRLYPEQFLRTPVLVPPLDEQLGIVRFLDWANDRLEKTIEAKRKVIALLSEQKQAIIHRATTRGLDREVFLRPSGVEWLGDIPHHWEVRKLKHLTRFANGLPFKPGDWKAEGTPIIRIQNLNGSEVFNYTNRKGLPEALLIQPGDLMFAWSGNRGTSFGSFEWTRDFSAYLNQHIFKLVGYTLPKRYFYYVLRAVTRHVEEQAGGIIGLVHVTKPELGSVQVPLAPTEEAEAIAHHIVAATEGIDRVIYRLACEIDLLHEYRTRLVADVVTGKLDVREAAARLPMEDMPDAGRDLAVETYDAELTDEEAEA
jgi:type I restriction enzyme, S subunit